MPRKAGSEPPAISAPDLTGPVSILNWPVASGGKSRRRRPGPIRHAHLEVDLVPGTEIASSLPILRQLEDALREAEVHEMGSLVVLAGGALHGFSSAGYQYVDHWEVRPGGWLPLHHLPRSPQAVGVGALLQAMRLKEWKTAEGAREFAARLRGGDGRRLEFVLRRIHRERRHSLSIDLHGSFPPQHLHDVVAALGRHLPVLHSNVTSVLHAADRT